MAAAKLSDKTVADAAYETEDEFYLEKKEAEETEDEYDDDDDDDDKHHSENENQKDYCKGGYHPVSIGDTYGPGRRYVIEKKLGWGHFSTVWLASDREIADTHPHKLVALKIQKSASKYTEAALDEIKLFKDINSNSSPARDATIVTLLNHFFIHGPNGKHVCLVFEPMGPNLLHLIRHYSHCGIPTYLLKSITHQALIGLDFLHSQCRIIHTDLKPENFLLSPAVPFDYATIAAQRDHPGSLTIAKAELLKKTASLSTLPGDAESHADAASSADADQRKAAVKRSSNLSNANGAPSKKLSKNQKKRLRQRQKKQLFAASKTDNADPSVTGEAELAKVDADAGHAEAKMETKAVPEEGESKTVADICFVAAKCSEAVLDAKDGADEKDGEVPIEKYAMTRLPLPVYTEDDMKEGKYVLGDGKYPLVAKIADMGNGCWVHKHFTSDITTTEYRSPESIVGASYGTATDMWSFGCIVFELAVGDYLFKPKKGKGFSRDEDHLAQMSELLGRFPKKLWDGGKRSRDFFNRKGEFRHISDLKPWALRDVLIDKHKMEPAEAEELSSFLLPMLSIDPATRITAADALAHPWLRVSPAEITSAEIRIKKAAKRTYRKTLESATVDQQDAATNKADEDGTAFNKFSLKAEDEDQKSSPSKKAKQV